MPEKITSKQENHIVDLVRDAVRSLELSKDEAQEIVKSGDILQNEIKPILRRLAISDKRFGPAVREFKLTVPGDYDDPTQIDQFGKKARALKTTHYYNNALTSQNFANATNKLQPGKTYTVKIFPILSQVSSEDSLAFLRKQKAILVGGQGLTLAQELKGEEFPKGKWTVSFDEKEALWKDSDGHHGVPFVFARTDGDFLFVLGSFENDWYEDLCLLCFCDDESLDS
jgi:hypothetical protein